MHLTTAKRQPPLCMGWLNTLCFYLFFNDFLHQLNQLEAVLLQYWLHPHVVASPMFNGQ